MDRNLREYFAESSPTPLVSGHQTSAVFIKQRCLTSRQLRSVAPFREWSTHSGNNAVILALKSLSIQAVVELIFNCISYFIIKLVCVSGLSGIAGNCRRQVRREHCLIGLQVIKLKIPVGELKIFILSL